MADEPKRVCVTGIGVVSAYGRTAEAFWNGLCAGASALAPIAGVDAAGVAAQVRDYAPRDDIDPDAAAALDRRALFAADAAIQALLQADIPVNAETVSEIGVAAASEMPEESVATAAKLARTLGAAGPVLHVSAGAAGGLMAIGEAAEWVRREECSIAVAGGAEAPVTAEAVAHFDAQGMLTKTAARPYDAERDGFALGEGAAFVVLEDEDVAVRRAAHILGYVDGYGATFSRAAVVQPRANEFDSGRAMQKALIKWGLTLQSEIDVIFGTGGGGAVDAVEARAIDRVWGPNKDRLWMTSIKGSVGHTLGASGAMSFVAALYALQAGLIPPTAGLRRADEACAGLDIVAGDVRRFTGSRAMVNAFGLGHAASVVVSRG